MAVKTSKVKTPLGMQTLTYYPIKTEPDNAHPTYDTGVDLGAAVKEAAMADSTKYSAGAMALLKANLGFYGTDAPVELVSYWGSLLEYSHDAFADMGIPLQPGTLADDMDQMTFAAWMYRNGPTGAGKTEQLRGIIRNRQVQQALEAEVYDL